MERDQCVTLKLEQHEQLQQLRRADRNSIGGTLMYHETEGRIDALEDLYEIFATDEHPWTQAMLLITNAAIHQSGSQDPGRESYFEGYFDALKRFKEANEEHFPRLIDNRVGSALE